MHHKLHGHDRRINATVLFDLPNSVWAITLVFVATLILYSQLIPLYYSQDEREHADLAWSVRDRTGWPDREHSIFDHRWVEARDLYRYANRTQDNAIPRGQRPSLDDLADPIPDPAGEINNAWQHPPLYYAIVAAAITLVAPFTQAWPWDVSLAVIRLLSVGMMAPIPILAAATAHRLIANKSATALAAVLPLMVPALLQIGAAANNDNLLVLLVSMVTLLVAAVLTGDSTYRTATLLGILAAAVLLTKGTGLFLLGWIPLVYGLAAMRAGADERRRIIASGSLALGVPLVLGGWWWIRNLILYGTLQPTRVWPAPPTDFVPDAAVWLPRVVQAYVQTFWANFVQAPVPRIIPVAFAGIVASCLVLALLRAQGRRGIYLCLLAPLAGLLAILLYGSWNVYSSTARIQGAQGRYLYPAIASIASVASVGLRSITGASRWLFPAACLTAFAIQSWIIVFLLYAYWGKEGSSLWERVSAVLAWSPWPVPVLGLAFLAWCGGFLWLGRLAWREWATSTETTSNETA